jgi:large subunit ribosomal protein L24
MARINPKLLSVSKHNRDKMICARLDDALRNTYKVRNIRIVKGDSVRVVRGEYKGVEGKIEKVNTDNASLNIEGISREKIRGGQVKVPIHSSNVMVTALNLDDKYRSARLQGGGKPKSTQKSSSAPREQDIKNRAEGK